MVSSIVNLSSLATPIMSSGMSGLEFKQFKRTYPGNYSINFPLCLSAANDFRTKNYSNLYLTNNYKFSDIFEVDTTTLKAVAIFGPLIYGGNYLSYTSIDPTPYALAGRYQDHFNYWKPVFESTASDTTDFTFSILSDNKCNIYFTKEYKNYYLCIDIYDNLVFIKEKLLSFDSSTINPQDFKYMFSEDGTLVLFFKETPNSSFFITKSGNSLKAFPVVPNNAVAYTIPFKLSKNIYSYPNISLNTSFITYTNDNNVNIEKSKRDLSNNFLLHNQYHDPDPKTDIIVLKNQLLQEDVFSSSNNLLSSVDDSLFVNNLREYSAISEDIKEENSDDLALNYVFYNKTYRIKPGSNIFVSPSSLSPFSQLNINDTKFVSSGAFSYITPEFADKVYHLSPDPKNYNNEQYLLCTWLSGGSQSDNKLWVDRYYYPDLISKQAALSAKAAYNITYEDLIEDLIHDNADLTESIKTHLFFDKRSDLIFTANQTYRYDRLNNIPTFTSSFDYCNSYSDIYPSNYFNTINEKGEFTVGFNFTGESSVWTVKSDRNMIDSGLTIAKNGEDLTITYRIYDPTREFYDDSSNAWAIYTASAKIKSLKSNFVCVSVNCKTGKGYFYLNDGVLLNFTIPIYQFFIKQLLYGDFYLYTEDSKVDVLDPARPYISDIFINDYFIDSQLVFHFSILNSEGTINDIHITLPCGMRNSLDNIEYLNSVCGSSLFKSNNININIKNLNIDNANILTGITQSVTTALENVIPANTNINTIKFENFK